MKSAHDVDRHEGSIKEEVTSRQIKPTKPNERKTAIQSEAWPQRFSLLVAKNALQDFSPDTSDDDFSDNTDENSYESE